MASGDTLFSLTPPGEAPTSAAASFDTRNAHPVMDYDAATDESTTWTGVLPNHYSGLGISLTLVWAASTATSGNVKWNAQFERLDTATDTDADGFAAVQTATGAANATSGILTYTTIAFTNAQIDGLLKNETFRLKVTRDADDAADTMTGDAELFGVFARET
jgi:hypothetical protein